MWIKQDAGIRQLISIKKSYIRLFLLLCVGFIFHSHSLYAAGNVGKPTLTYYLSIQEFTQSLLVIPSTNYQGSTLLDSLYIAGRSPIYNNDNNEKVGVCSASFLCTQTEDGYYTDISNFISVDNGLVVSWFTPTTLINLETDSIINSMVTECLVTATTKIGVNPFYGQTFSLIVSSDEGRIFFQFSKPAPTF